MSKLIYKTKVPRKGCVFNESNSTHESSGFGDKLPEIDIQNSAMRIVGDDLRILVRKLEKLGYYPTKVRFSIYYK